MKTATKLYSAYAFRAADASNKLMQMQLFPLFPQSHKITQNHTTSMQLPLFPTHALRWLACGCSYIRIFIKPASDLMLCYFAAAKIICGGEEFCRIFPWKWWEIKLTRFKATRIFLQLNILILWNSLTHFVFSTSNKWKNLLTCCEPRDSALFFYIELQV